MICAAVIFFHPSSFSHPSSCPSRVCQMPSSYWTWPSSCEGFSHLGHSSSHLAWPPIWAVWRLEHKGRENMKCSSKKQLVKVLIKYHETTFTSWVASGETTSGEQWELEGNEHQTATDHGSYSWLESSQINKWIHFLWFVFVCLSQT